MTKEAPGLKIKRRRSGAAAYYWRAANVNIRAKSYEPRMVRLHETTEEGRAARCRVLTAQLLLWLSRPQEPRGGYDGTIAGLIRCYQADEDSPYRTVKHSTRADYDYSLDVLEKGVGGQHVADLTRSDFARWNRALRAPAQDGGPERIRRAWGCMRLLRMIFSYGKSMRYPGCREAAEVIEEMRFQMPKPRKMALAFDQAAAIVGRALEDGRPSIALAQALQFELSLRQIDVIGEWLPAERDASGIVNRGARWGGGLVWSDVSPELVLRKTTTKTGATGEWDLRKYPLVMMALTHQERGVGPMIVSEKTRRPYRANDFQKCWRAIARAVGVPDEVWNRDSRAGGITEGDDAGAEPRDLQKHATHSDFKTTSRYIRSSTRKATDKVAELRVKARGDKA